MVQMKVTASVLIAAAAIAPAVAYGFKAKDSLVARGNNEFASAYGRGLELDLNEREFYEELYEREPLGGMNSRGGSRHRHGILAPGPPTESQSERREFDDDLLEREFDEELYEREPFRVMGMVRGAARKFRGGSRHRQGGSVPSTPTESQRREFIDELMEREFDDELFGREYDSELFEREPEPRVGGWYEKVHGKTFARAVEARDFDELD